jgi:dTDP-4-dehydrorhamnose 3,5-epimerase
MLAQSDLFTTFFVPAMADGLRAGNFTRWSLPLDGPLLIQTRRFADARGVFVETFSGRDAEALGVEEDWVQDNFSRSAHRGTVRGLHFQTAPHAQAKLVRVLRGAVLDVAVDIRPGSATFGRHIAVELSGENGMQLYVPAGFAHGFCTLGEDTEVAYKVSDYYAPACDAGLAWDDPDLGIAWPVGRDAAVLSDKDARQPRLRDLVLG